MLMELKKRIELLREVELELEILNEKHDELLPKIKELEERMLEEQKDVERLEQVSFKSLLYSVTGKKGEKLEKEKAEAEEAVRKYKEICQELKKINNRIVEKERCLKAYATLEDDYAKEIRRKRNQIVACGGGNAKKISILEKRIDKLQDDYQRISDAKKLGEEILADIGQTDITLKNAEDTAVKQSFAGAASTLMEMKLGNLLSKAQGQASDLTKKIEQFQEMLKTIFKSEEESINLESFYEFGNGIYSYLVESSMIMDVATLQRIRGAKGLIMLSKEQVDKNLALLVERSHVINKELTEVKNELEEKIVTS